MGLERRALVLSQGHEYGSKNASCRGARHSALLRLQSAKADSGLMRSAHVGDLRRYRQGQITVAKNGAPCGIAFVMNGPSGGGFVSDPVLTTEPVHGSASARMSNGAALIFYSPSPDYVGPDRFVVGFSRDYTLTVGVSVVPLP
jgi:hypothetical protein